MAPQGIVRPYRYSAATLGSSPGLRSERCCRTKSQLAEPVPAGRSRLLNGPRRQNLLLLPRQPAQADELHAPNDTEGAQPALAVRGGWHGVRLVHTVSQADIRAVAVGRRRRVRN